MTLLFCLQALEYVKKTHPNDFSAMDEILMAIRHLFAASIVNGGPGPYFLAPWVYHYIIDGVDSISSFLPLRVDDRTLYSTAHNEVRINLRNIVGKLLLNILY